MRTFSLLAVLALAGSVPVYPQSCVARSQQIINVAVQKAGSSDEKQLRSQLQEAESNCATSPIIKRRLAMIYRDLVFDTAKADALLAEAQALEGKSATVEQPVQKVGLVRDKWALVVGVSKFAHLRDENQLSAPAKDARDFASALVNPSIGRFKDDGQHVLVLTDEQATLQQVMSKINYVSNKAQPDDLVVVYFSSHGTSAHDDRNASGDDQTGYIVTYDTRMDALFSTAFAMEELKRVLAHLRAQRVVVFLDTCFSGDSLRRFKENGSKGLAAIQDDQFERVVQGTGRVLIVSSSGSQQSWEGATNSFFTECLIRAMEENNGLNTVTQLFARLDHDLPYMVEREKNAKQTPLMWPQGQNLNIVIGTPIQ
jgi:Caspase domain